MLYLAVVVIYFTYVADVLERGTLSRAVIPILYAAVGLFGMVGVLTGVLVERVGSVRVAALCLTTVGVALALLGLASGSLVATAASPCIFGAGYMTGSAVLAVWTAQLMPHRAGAAFTACLILGALSSVAAPALAGVLIPSVGLGVLLVLSAALSLIGGVAFMLRGSSRGAAVARDSS
ncbi:hypothetical protein [uncultured Serinicoccus sp.]|uniref:hypothetical protein n=1 Tax=uncultured Serinicoccus sp. TaxID=735514 RepID=UPI002632FDFC|nr:hypothetical protein [uncultured Serinicoccus sp.]